MTRTELCAALAAKLGFRGEAQEELAAALHFRSGWTKRTLQQLVDYVPGEHGTDPEAYRIALAARRDRTL